MKASHRVAVLTLGLAAAAAQAQTQVQIGGQIRLTANRIETGDKRVYELRDNASRLSFRGSEDLGDGLKALFGLEMGLDADAGTATNPQYRYSYVGLSGGFGALALGRLDSANPTGSPLYSQVTAITSFAPNDAGATAIGTSMLNSRNRTSNSIGYRSPTLAGFDLRARAYLRGLETPTETEQSARSLDLGLNYAEGALKAGLGWGRDERSGGLKPNEFEQKWQLGLRYDMGAFEPYALFGTDQYKATATSRRKVDYWIVGAKLGMGPHSWVLNLMERDVQTNRSGTRKRQQLSYQYALSKRSELQAFVDHDGIDSSRQGVAVRAIGAGIRHDF